MEPLGLVKGEFFRHGNNQHTTSHDSFLWKFTTNDESRLVGKRLEPNKNHRFTKEIIWTKPRMIMFQPLIFRGAQNSSTGAHKFSPQKVGPNSVFFQPIYPWPSRRITPALSLNRKPLHSTCISRYLPQMLHGTGIFTYISLCSCGHFLPFM